MSKHSTKQIAIINKWKKQHTTSSEKIVFYQHKIETKKFISAFRFFFNSFGFRTEKLFYQKRIYYISVWFRLHYFAFDCSLASSFFERRGERYTSIEIESSTHTNRHSCAQVYINHFGGNFALLKKFFSTFKKYVKHTEGNFVALCTSPYLFLPLYSPQST